MTASIESRHALVIGGGAPPVLHIAEFLTLLASHGWRASFVATPTAATWVDLDRITAETGCVTASAPRLPGEASHFPDADMVIAAPLTFNTLNQWAAGISDTLALGILNETLGSATPIVAVPCIKQALREHPAYAASVDRLSRAGVTLLNPDAIIRRLPHGLVTFDWQQLVGMLPAM